VLTPEITLLMVRLTDSFSDFWPLLAKELEVPLTEWRPGEGEPPPPGAALVLIAAGGSEPDLPSFINQLTIPSDIPIAAVGAVASHRIAAQAVAAGAADYFALPEDREALRDFAAAALTLNPAMTPVVASDYRAAPGAVDGQMNARFLSLGIGKSVVLDLPRDIKDVLVAEPKFANAVVRSTRRAYLIGVAVGQTNIYFFDAEGKQIAGFDVAVTEIDKQIPLPVTDAGLAAQATDYANALTACLALTRCISFTTWGFSDKYNYESTGATYGAAALSDKDLAWKPAYYALRDVLTD